MNRIDDIIASSLDGRDYRAAALAIAAHPRSIVLSRNTISKLFEFGLCRVDPRPVDVAMIQALGDLMRVDLGSAP